ncbi:MAG: hypothetical protein N2C14_10080, partial [Planctomycetales bacterium]
QDRPKDCARAILEQLEQPEVQLNLARSWAMTRYQWVAPGLGHNPLYFEDVPLERYGQTFCPALQPIVSGAKFWGTVPMLPYIMTLKHPTEHVYTLGYHRPGSRAPWVRQTVPWSLKAAAVEAGVITGLILLVP